MKEESILQKNLRKTIQNYMYNYHAEKMNEYMLGIEHDVLIPESQLPDLYLKTRIPFVKTKAFYGVSNRVALSKSDFNLYPRCPFEMTLEY